jgi:hypothetical protein
MALPPGYKAVVVRHAAAPKEVQDYFKHLPTLVQNYPHDIALGYLFAGVERAHRMSIYCGVVKMHRADAVLARRTVHLHYMSREQFTTLFNTVYSGSFPKAVTTNIEDAEKVRDMVLHGRRVSAADLRKALVDVLDYAEGFNMFVHSAAGFRPFGDLRGFKGRAQSLDKSTTRWLLKGMGLNLS